MRNLILETKLLAPQRQPNRVARPRLVHWLIQAAQSPLVILSAPAGFGKTTALGEWAATLNLNQACLAWLRLEEEDNDPARFFSYLSAALERVYTGVGEEAQVMLQSTQAQPPRQVLTALLWSLGQALPARLLDGNDPGGAPAVPGELYLVLDDYHEIRNPGLQDAMLFLIEHLPAGMHLLIATRIDPPFPLGRLRASGRMVEIRANELRFSLEEENQFFEQRTGLRFDEDTLNRLDARLEGWAAGLQLACLTMQPGSVPADIDRILRFFSGSNRHVADYLVEEVLNRQPPDIQAFFLQTAILDQLNGPLCQAVSGRPDSDALLDRLERSNMFITALDDTASGAGARWYRYHPLFADLLSLRLQQAPSEWKAVHGDPAELHCHAAAWLAAHGLLDSAIRHALAGGDQRMAAELIFQAGESTWMHGEFTTLLRWLSALPQPLRIAQPRLGILLSWGVTLSGRLDLLSAAGSELGQIEAVLRPSGELPVEGSPNGETFGMLCTVRGVMASAFEGDIPAALERAELALRYLPETNPVWRAAARLSLGHAYYGRGEVTPALEAYTEAIRLNQAAGNVHLALRSAVYHIWALYDAGQLAKAVQEMENLRQKTSLLSEAGQPTFMGAHFISGYIHYQWNRLNEALEDMDQARRLGERWNNQGIPIQCLAFQVLIHLARGDAQGVEKAFAVARRLVCHNEPTERIYAPYLDALQALIWLRQNQLELARSWAHGRVFPGVPAGQQDFPALVLARVLIGIGQPGDTLAYLEKAQSVLEGHGQVVALIEILLLHALALYGAGQYEPALHPLRRALELGESESFLRVFLDEGRPLAELLESALPHLPDRLQDYARKLSFAFRQAQGAPKREAGTGLVEPLTGRELEILRLIAEGCSNPDIARRLYLALNTVKVHIKNMYAKLAVENRAQAIRRGRELNLL